MSQTQEQISPYLDENDTNLPKDLDTNNSDTDSNSENSDISESSTIPINEVLTLPPKTKEIHQQKFFYKKMHPWAKKPSKATPLAAGYDLYSINEICIAPGDTIKIYTGIAIEMPEDCYGRIAGRSGICARYSLCIHSGVVDADFQGSIFVTVQNLGKKIAYFPVHTRFAQLIFTKIYTPSTLEEVSDFSTNTVRGSGCLGSSGLM
jgi:dUTP pyrophosphatase